ncbi:hypothetical protein ACFC0M_13410 [Streptomyces sp. NPDC056149]|uniref:MmyB family transcriptional regulator n=1 Tax=Streptomyces sp. NPDC056149 TaxID=3345728 RepID=UPI0035E0E76C
MDHIDRIDRMDRTECIDRKSLLKALLRAHRALGDRTEFGWRPQERRDGRGRPVTGIDQGTMARLFGRESLWYRQRENGVKPFTIGELDRIADRLGMTWRARVALFRRALGCDPHPVAGPASTNSPRTNAWWTKMLKPHAACLTDAAFNLLDHNAEFATMLGPLTVDQSSHTNVMRLLLLDASAPTAHRSKEAWHAPLAAELIEAVALHANDPDLRQLHADALRNPTVGPLYRGSAAYTFPDQNSRILVTTLHPGVRRVAFLRSGDAASR